MTFSVFFSSFLFLLAFGFGHLVADFVLYFPSRWSTRDDRPISQRQPLTPLLIHLFDSVVCRIRYDFWSYAFVVALVDVANSSLWHAAGNQSGSCSAAANGVITQQQQQQHSETVAEHSSREMGEWVNGWMPSHCSLTPATIRPPLFPHSSSSVSTLHSCSWQSEWAAGAIVVASCCYCCCGYGYCSLAVWGMCDLCCSLTRGRRLIKYIDINILSWHFLKLF